MKPKDGPDKTDPAVNRNIELGVNFMNYKLVISDPKSKKAYQKEIDQKQTGLRGKKIGEKVQGNSLGLPGYELEITGGSDREGFPMRRDVEGFARKKVLLALPPGFHPKMRGQRKRKSVRGNTVSEHTSQVNLKVVTIGKESLDKLLGSKPKAEEAKPEGKKEEKPAEKKEESKPEAKPEEKKEEPGKESKGEKPKPEGDSEKAEKKMGVKDIEEAEKAVKDKK